MFPYLILVTFPKKSCLKAKVGHTFFDVHFTIQSLKNSNFKKMSQGGE